MLVAGADFDAEADAQVGDEIAVIDVAGATRLLWIVANGGTLLMAVEGLDGDVDVEDPRQAEGGRDAAEDLGGKPVEAGRFLDASHGEAHSILADDTAHS